jgi:hypothetical protein
MDTATDSDENIHWHTIVAWQVLNCDGPGSIPDLNSFFQPSRVNQSQTQDSKESTM